MKLLACLAFVAVLFLNVNVVALENSNKSLAINFDDIPFDKSIKIVKGDGTKKIAVFYEIDCAYCKKIEKFELSHVSDVTIYNFIFVNESKDSVSWKKAEAIWCASDVIKAWNDFIIKDYVATNTKSCTTPFEFNKTLALKLGVTGTPTIFFSNGTKSSGMTRAKEIQQRLLDADFYGN